MSPQFETLIKDPAFDSIEHYITTCNNKVSFAKSLMFKQFNKHFISPSFYKSTNKQSKYSVLLIHGLLDSTAIMQNLFEFFKDQNITVLNFLLPGHGTKPMDLHHITWQDWIQSVATAIHLLKEPNKKLITIGLSTGAIINCYLKTIGAPIDAFITYAAAFSLRLPQFMLTHLYQALHSLHLTNSPWLFKRREIDAYKYQSLSANGVRQLQKLCTLTKKNIKAAPITIPTLNIFSDDDETISPKAIQQYLPLKINPKNQAIRYTTKTVSPQKNTHVVTSAYPDENIINFSHVCMPVSPEHPIYGKNRFNHSDTKGALKLSNQLFYPIKRLTYNPHFDSMMSIIKTFITSL